jgi:glycosyltransferase involved in cell wall biosynthesis
MSRSPDHPITRSRLIVVLAPEPIRARMAGMGIRALELARTLARRFDVLLLVPNGEAEAREAAAGVAVASAMPDGLEAAARDASAAVVSGHAATTWFERAPEVPVAADLYDPFAIENLHYARALGDGAARSDFTAMRLAAARADFFLCASAEQRLFYAGLLYAAGRVGASNFPDDPTLSRLLAVVPFGVPEEPASGDRARGRALAAVPPEGPLVLFGGIYDWYDPDLLLDAWPAIRRSRPDARLLFFENPNRETTPQHAFARARARSRDLDPSGESIVFSRWLPYSARADLYAASDVLVSIGSEGLETDLAFRTRLLDAAWGGVPSVTVGGGPLARELADAGACRPIRRDAGELAKAVLASIGGNPSARENARRFAATRTWPRVAAPLADWCARARRDPGRRELAKTRRGGWMRFLSG